ncbi:hydrolase [Methylobacter sp. G7]|uniref:hydrolase n=1 Tax=Methylobacter sp. G7 TaxID=3230117 RepID=UPI003D806731
MQSYIFLDLDDTLFQTLRKCAPDVDNHPLQARAFLPDGSANSYATQKQQWLWHWLAKGFKIVPVTARDVHAFERVNLPFQEEVVLNHGAVILNKQGTVDKVWMDNILQSLPAYQEKLLAVWAEVELYAQRHCGFKPRLVNDFGTTWYGVIKHSDGTEAILKTLLDEVIIAHPHVLDGSLYWHLNGNNLALLPKIINKESAVSYLLEGYKQQHSKVLTFGAGDSKTDAAFMALCDYALIPKNTQLFQALDFAETT